jgi:hypothetical protein
MWCLKWELCRRRPAAHLASHTAELDLSPAAIAAKRPRAEIGRT